MSFRFAEPLWLAALLLLPLLAWLRGAAGRPAAIRFPSALLAETVASVSRSSRGGLGRWLRLLALAAFILALARPQAGTEQVNVDSSGLDIMLVLDLSDSMWAHDFELDGQAVDRLAVVRDVVVDFIGQRRDDRIGLVAFATSAYLVSPLTLNHDWLRQNVERLELGKLDGRSTAIGDAIATATNRLRKVEAKDRVVILLTDGEHNAGSLTPVTAAEAAASFGMKVYTIGIGREGVSSVPFPLLDPEGKPARDVFGRLRLRSAQSRVDFTTLRRVSELTGAKSFSATDTDALRRVYTEIDALEKTERRLRVRTDYKEHYAWPLAAGILILLVEVVAGSTRYRRLP